MVVGPAVYVIMCSLPHAYNKFNSLPDILQLGNRLHRPYRLAIGHKDRDRVRLPMLQLGYAGDKLPCPRRQIRRHFGYGHRIIYCTLSHGSPRSLSYLSPNAVGKHLIDLRRTPPGNLLDGVSPSAPMDARLHGRILHTAIVWRNVAVATHDTLYLDPAARDAARP